MLTEKEKNFLRYWEARRDIEKKISWQLLVGIPIGLLFSLPILFIVFTGKLWYKRADMVANAQGSPVVLVIAVFIITVFVAVFYKRHQWDQREQQYRQLKAREDQEGSSMQL